MNDGTKALLAEARVGLPTLTTQERRALELAGEGLSNAAIGEAMGHANERATAANLLTTYRKLWPSGVGSFHNVRVVAALLIAGG